MKRHMKINPDTFDIYINVAGGVDIKSPSADLAVLAAIVSSIQNIPVPPFSLFIGEVGLLGEIRKTMGQEKILSEGERIGLTRAITSDLRRTSALLDIMK